MSKNKKKKWWMNDVQLDDAAEMFPNTVRQHNEQLNKKSGAVTVKTYDENGNVIDEYEYDEDEYYQDYYGWGRKSFQQNIGKPKDQLGEELKGILGDINSATNSRSKKLYASDNRIEFAQEWDRSWKSGKWQGYSYYQQPTLTYRYVQQMANALAAQHKIEVKVGNYWDCDLKTKTLTYNPASLVYSTKSELLATLLHEIGKLRYSTGYEELEQTQKSNYIVKYGVNAYRAILPFEELRIDTKMLGEYGSAGEIYESQEPALQTVYENYRQYSANLKEKTIENAMNLFKSMIQDVEGGSPNSRMVESMAAMAYIQQGYNEMDAIAKVREDALKNTDSDRLKKRLQQVFGVDTKEEALEEFKKMCRSINDKDTLYDYIAAIYSVAYSLEREGESSEGIKERVEKTKSSLKTDIKLPKTIDVLEDADKNVFPVIEDLLEDAKNGFKELDRFGEKFRKQVTRQTEDQLGYLSEDTIGDGSSGKQKVRMPMSSGQSNQTTVPEWFDGNYKVLKDSVRSEITRLTRMLNFLRRTEMQTRWVGNQRRGRLDMKKLYKVGTGSRRVFKHKQETTDTVRSFAFSILIDVSGSMNGSRIANTTRGLVILAEVFKDMSIPFELITFSDGAKSIKSFDQSMDSGVEKKIGGLPNSNGGGTNLNRGLDEMTIKFRPEKNKVCIVLTDGGVGRPEYYNQEYFQPMQKNDHIQSLAFGLEISQHEIGELCNGTGRAIKNAVEVPYVFSDLLKS